MSHHALGRKLVSPVAPLSCTASGTPPDQCTSALHTACDWNYINWLVRATELLKVLELRLDEYHGPKKMQPKVKQKMRDCKPGWTKNSLRIDSRTVSGTDSSTERRTDKPGKLSERLTRVWMYTITKVFFSSSGKIHFCKYPLSAASAESPFKMLAVIWFAW